MELGGERESLIAQRNRKNWKRMSLSGDMGNKSRKYKFERHFYVSRLNFLIPKNIFLKGLKFRNRDD